MTWKQRADFAALCAWLVGSLTMALMALWWYGQDFRGYYAAARVVLMGGNPYDYGQVAPVLLAVTGRAGNNPYYYPPWFAPAVIPLALLPFDWARASWMALNLSVWLGSLWWLARLLDWPAPGWRRWLVCLLATYLFAWVTWRFEQIGVLMLALLVAALWAERAGQDIGCGLCLALMLTKPNATAVIVAALLTWLASRRRWRAIRAWALTLAGLLILATLLIPGWFQPFTSPGFGRGLTDELDGPGRVVATRINTTMLDWLASLGVSSLGRLAIYGLAAVASLGLLAVVVWRAGSPLALAAIAGVVGFIVTPYALQYDFPPLTVTLFWALSTLGGRANWMRTVGAALTAFVASVPVWERPISDGFWIVISLGALSGLAALVSDRSKGQACAGQLA